MGRNRKLFFSLVDYGLHAGHECDSNMGTEERNVGGYSSAYQERGVSPP